MNANRTAKQVKERLVFYSEKDMKTNIKKEAAGVGLSVSSYLNMVIKKELMKNA